MNIWNEKIRKHLIESEFLPDGREISYTIQDSLNEGPGEMHLDYPGRTVRLAMRIAIQLEDITRGDSLLSTKGTNWQIYD